MTDAEEKPTFDADTAGAISKKVQLTDLLFVGMEARVLGPLLDGSVLSFDIPPLNVQWRRDGQDLRVIVPYRLVVEQQEGAAAKPRKALVAEIRVLLRVDYVLAGDAEITDDQIYHFVGLSTFMHSWPYLRSEVEHLTTKLRLPPLVLPLVVSGNAADYFRVRQMRPVETDERAAPLSIEPGGEAGHNGANVDSGKHE